MKHTPGPWKTHLIGSNKIAQVICGDNSKFQVFEHAADGQSIANAHLMSAAPELLKSVESLIEKHRELLTMLTGSSHHENPEAVDAMRDKTIYKEYFDAINKAKGKL